MPLPLRFVWDGCVSGMDAWDYLGGRSRKVELNYGGTQMFC